MLHYVRLLALLSINLRVAWQLLLVSYNAKVIQLPCWNSSCKGACGTLHKWLLLGVWGKYHCVCVVEIDLRCMLDLLWNYCVSDKSYLIKCLA